MVAGHHAGLAKLRISDAQAGLDFPGIVEPQLGFQFGHGIERHRTEITPACAKPQGLGGKVHVLAANTNGYFGIIGFGVGPP